MNKITHNEIIYNLSQSILSECDNLNIDIRLFGSAALLFLDKSKFSWISKNRKPVEDIDIVVNDHQIEAIESYFLKQGFDNNRIIKMLHGNERRSFYSHDNISIDIFIGNIILCQKINLSKRFKLSYPTISTTDLFLTKIQKLKLSESDIFDINYILDFNIDKEYITSLCINDWCWWKTLETNIPVITKNAISDSNRKILIDLWESITLKNKSFKWEIRNFIGSKKQWYNDVEE